MKELHMHQWGPTGLCGNWWLARDSTLDTHILPYAGLSGILLETDCDVDTHTTQTAYSAGQSLLSELPSQSQALNTYWHASGYKINLLNCHFSLT